MANMRRRGISIFSAVICGAIFSHIAFGQQIEHALDQKLRATAAIDQEMRGLATFGERSVEQVIGFSVRDGRIEPTSPLPVTGQNFHTVTLAGFGGRAKVAVWSDETIHSAKGRRFVQLYYRDLSVPGTIDEYTEITATADSVMISQAADLGDDLSWSVQLVQSTSPGPRGVMLYVQLSDGKPARHFGAASLAELAVVNPAEVDAYLRPIFRLFHQEQNVFAVDAKVGYQMLGEYWRDDPELAAAVNKVSGEALAAVAGLAADSYGDREKAMSHLRELAEPAALFLMTGGAKNLTPEQNARVDTFLAAYRPAPEELAGKIGDSPDFLLDCLFSEEAPIRHLALARLQRVSGKTLDIDANLSGRALDEAVTKLRLSLAPPATQP